jgi:hypothetical protein
MNEPEGEFTPCCFCGRPITDEEPRLLSLAVDDGGEQELWCHEECLRRALHPSVPLAV